VNKGRASQDPQAVVERLLNNENLYRFGFSCPFCRQKAFIAEGQEEGDAGVMHVMPLCAKFEQLGALEYITAVRKALGAN
jgi:hypothetical protein